VAISDAQSEIIAHGLPQAEAADRAMQALASSIAEKAGFLENILGVLPLENTSLPAGSWHKLDQAKTWTLRSKERHQLIRSHVSDASGAIARAAESPDLPVRKQTEAFLAGYTALLAEVAEPITEAVNIIDRDVPLLGDLAFELEEIHEELLYAAELIQNRGYQGETVHTLKAFARDQEI
jgi:hypothetical protein